MTTYDFDDQLAKGEAAEQLLDEHFTEWFEIAKATPDEQKHGIDRWFTGRSTGARLSVEYKTDWLASRTRNAFVEIDSGAIRGWAYTTQANRIVYYVPGPGWEVAYILSPSRMRALLPVWEKKYRHAWAKNEGYSTEGVLVPLAVFERIAMQVVSL